MLTRFSFVFMLLFVAASVQAAESNGEIPYSYYLITCTDYVKHRADESAAEHTADMFYVAGWLSAYNRLKADSGVPEDTKLEEVMAWLESYCRNSLDSNLQNGLFAYGDASSKKRMESAAATPVNTLPIAPLPSQLPAATHAAPPNPAPATGLKSLQ